MSYGAAGNFPGLSLSGAGLGIPRGPDRAGTDKPGASAVGGRTLLLTSLLSSSSLRDLLNR